MKRTKYSVAVVIKNRQNELLIVKRPIEANSQLSGIWGLPAVTLRKGESELDGSRRIGTEKLGVSLLIGDKIGERLVDHGEHYLHLSDYAAEIIGDAMPVVPQKDKSITQYIAVKYTSDPAVLIPAAKEGSSFADLTAIIRYTLGINL